MITDGTKRIMEEIRFTSNGDAFGAAQAWRFAIADVLYVCDAPPTGYKPHPHGVSLESYESHVLVSMLAEPNRTRVTIGDLQYVLSILDRAREGLAALGKEY